MTNQATLKRGHRRDRRKAKASGWRREGKTSMNGSKVAHGTSGSAGGPRDVRSAVRVTRNNIEAIFAPNRLKARIEDIIQSKKTERKRDK